MSAREFLRIAHEKPFGSITELMSSINSQFLDGHYLHIASKNLTEDTYINISDTFGDPILTTSQYNLIRCNITNHLCRDIDNSIFIAYKKNLDIDNEIIYYIEAFIKDILYSRLSSIRDNVVEASYKSKDFSSFAYRLIDGVARQYFNVEACSMYALDPRNGFLRLASTTGWGQFLEKKDVFYPEGHENRPFSVLRSGRIRCFQSDDIADADTYKEKLKSLGPYSILYVPIKRMHQNEKDTDRQIGVLKLINPHRKLGDNKQSKFHELDKAELNFFSETVSVLSQNYTRALEAEDNFERTIHGFRTDLESSADHLDTLGHLVFREDAKYLDPDTPFDGGPFSIGEIRRLHEDALAFLDDLSFQIEKARLLVHERNEIIEHFHADVLAPMLKMVSSMIVSNSSLAADINKLTVEGSLELPPIVGSKSGYISVLRNLLENSIKYRRPNAAPKIRISFNIKNEIVELRIRDYGIGIRRNEERFLFVEGFRSVGARRASFKGAGIGLSYSRDVMRIMGGDLEYCRVDVGMEFVVKMPRSKNAGGRTNK